jgi:hypothetical protein
MLIYEPTSNMIKICMAIPNSRETTIKTETAFEPSQGNYDRHSGAGGVLLSPLPSTYSGHPGLYLQLNDDEVMAFTRHFLQV